MPDTKRRVSLLIVVFCGIIRDYLLKPIKKKELTDALERMNKRYRERNEQLSFEEKVRLGLKNGAGRLRTSAAQRK